MLLSSLVSGAAVLAQELCTAQHGEFPAALAEARAGSLLLAQNARALQAGDGDHSHLQRRQQCSESRATQLSEMLTQGKR